MTTRCKKLIRISPQHRSHIRNSLTRQSGAQKGEFVEANWGRGGGDKRPLWKHFLCEGSTVFTVSIFLVAPLQTIYTYVRVCGIQILSILTYLLMCIVLPRVVCPCLHLSHCHLLPPLQLTQVLRVRGELTFYYF